MAIDLVRLDPAVSSGFSQILAMSVDMTRMPNRATERVINAQSPFYAWMLSKDRLTKARAVEMRAFWMERRGGGYAFRFFDVIDHTTAADGVTAPTQLDQYLGDGDGATTRFRLRKQYSASVGVAARACVRQDFLPIHGETDDRLNRLLGRALGTAFTMLVALDGVATTLWSFDWQTKEIVFDSPPGAGVEITFGCYFDCPSIFGPDTSEALETTINGAADDSIVGVQIESVPEERMVPEVDDPGGYRDVQDMLQDQVLNKAVAKFWDLDVQAASLAAVLEDPRWLGPGGFHFWIRNYGAHTLDVRDHLGNAVGTIATSSVKTAWLKEAGGALTWQLT